MMVWLNLFAHFSITECGYFENLCIDSTAINVHPQSVGEKNGVLTDGHIYDESVATDLL